MTGNTENTAESEILTGVHVVGDEGTIPRPRPRPNYTATSMMLGLAAMGGMGGYGYSLPRRSADYFTRYSKPPLTAKAKKGRNRNKMAKASRRRNRR